MMHVT